ncbi:hypothetical protein KQ51_00581 [Candidatus Izimaplasma bacterium HR1]|jgi:hypothetical protein|uniref:hypothetical protein n=1 Tax=Candidatus Izimoplasma sp. HR1 TaxID=1541959 RepID=UPI0004F71773|nr:hypothetical protein KQ51_00581 [Candidatus Izimaplasma bacterium HR1]
MDYHKLKLTKFSTYNGFNLPEGFNPPLEESSSPEVYFLFVSNVQEVMQGLNVVQNNQTHKDNRLFFVFKKGNKGFGRDHIYSVVMRHKNIKRKAPMLASLNRAYSVFCFLLEV